MKPDGLDELKELIAFLKENEIAEFDLDRGDLKVRLKFASAGSAHAASATGSEMASLARLLASHSAGSGSTAGLPAAASPAAGEQIAAAEENLHIVKSPIVGTFY